MPERRVLSLASVAALVLTAAATLGAADWPHWRGPNYDGTAPDRNLPASWSPAGENLAWKAPYGGRSTPIVVGDRLYLQSPSGQNETTQERITCFDVATGKVLWEFKHSLYLSDVPMHRVAWSSPTGDAETGNIYVMGGQGRLFGLDRNGKLLWDRSLNEDFGVITTHGGRTVSPVVEGDLVIVNALHSGWAEFPRPGNRWIAVDKRTGETVWISSPQRGHYDTNYPPGYVTTVGDKRLLIWPGSDGAVYGMKVHTGELVFRYEYSKRALNTGVIVRDNVVYVNHSEENLDTNEMGMMGAFDASLTGDISKAQLKWTATGFQGGFSSPVLVDGVLYQVDNGAVLAAFDAASGKKLWDHHLGTVQKASLAYGDGKLYVGTENGKFFILQPSRDGVKVLDEDQLGAAGDPEIIIAGAAIANGQVFVVSQETLYAIGKPQRTSSSAGGGNGGGTMAAPSAGEPAHVQVVPAEVTLAPGETAKFRVRLFDANGNFVREGEATWSTERLPGAVASDGTFTAAAGEAGAWGSVKAAVGPMTGMARVRVVPALPWSFDFENSAVPPQWTNTTNKFKFEQLDGSTVLLRPEDNTIGRRTRVGMGPSDWTGYTIEADIRSATRRRQQGDIGLINQRYALVLFGNAQKIELQPWQPATPMTVSAPFTWNPDTWYRMKLRVENLSNGSTRVQGKVWPRAEAEPSSWTVEKTDTIPHREGTPGLYADAITDLYFDNVTVRKNQQP